MTNVESLFSKGKLSACTGKTAITTVVAKMPRNSSVLISRVSRADEKEKCSLSVSKRNENPPFSRGKRNGRVVVGNG